MINHRYIFTVSILLSVFIGCFTTKDKLIPTYNKGGYKIYILSKKSAGFKIVGKVFDVANGQPLSNAKLTIGCFRFWTSSKGEYSFKTDEFKNLDSLYIEAISIGYKKVETGFINLKNNNGIRIDFYLAQDDRPLINCEGEKKIE